MGSANQSSFQPPSQQMMTRQAIQIHNPAAFQRVIKGSNSVGAPIFVDDCEAGHEYICGNALGPLRKGKQTEEKVISKKGGRKWVKIYTSW